jgi:diaminopimelate epimerase
MAMKFVKMHGIGNDFVMVNAVAQPVDLGSIADLARQICSRRFGVGSDGLILALPSEASDLEMRMWNPDGSESEMCGNGVRCFAAFAIEEGLAKPGPLKVMTGAGELVLNALPNGEVEVDMGPARLERGEIGMSGPVSERFVDQPIEVGGQGFRGTAVSMGNPHLVLLVDDADAIRLEELGPILEHHELFPARTNVHFVQVLGENLIIQRTWERGAGVTLACGTGACASLVAAALSGKSSRKAVVRLPGGELLVEWREDGRVMMTGPAERVFDGVWN